MLSFAVYTNGKPADKVNLSGAYVVGSDDVPLRAEISFKNGVIMCKKKAAGPAGLALLWDVPGIGRLMLETGRVLERKQPYVLQVELARGRLTRIAAKSEDWGLIDTDEAEDRLKKVEGARDLLIKALQSDTPAEAAVLGQQALDRAVQASENLSRFHAGILLGRRRQNGGLPKRLFGCAISLDKLSELKRQRLSTAFDFVTLPFNWRDIEPTEQTFNWKPLDGWVETLAKNRIPIKGSSLLSFREGSVPDWMFIWEHDFDTMRDMAFEHARRVMNRYGQYIQVWDAISGIHGPNCFGFNFEQIMELTRMSTALVKQIVPRGTAIVELVAPWGEYYARNQRTIPPMLYADMLLQSNINFDAFGLQVFFGAPEDGSFVRDMFQISAMLDTFAKLGKPLHITAVQVPSDTTTVKAADGATDVSVTDGGTWHRPWAEDVQSEWLRQFAEVALSKPYVDSVSWRALSDAGAQSVPHGGLLKADLSPKAAFHELIKLRSDITGVARTADAK